MDLIEKRVSLIKETFQRLPKQGIILAPLIIQKLIQDYL
jgi:hypothetical protein